MPLLKTMRLSMNMNMTTMMMRSILLIFLPLDSSIVVLSIIANTKLTTKKSFAIILKQLNLGLKTIKERWRSSMLDFKVHSEHDLCLAHVSSKMTHIAAFSAAHRYNSTLGNDSPKPKIIVMKNRENLFWFQLTNS